MNTVIKKFVTKELKKVGSHLGTVKAAFENQYPNYNFVDYKEFAQKIIDKRYANVETKIRASVRFQ